MPAGEMYDMVACWLIQNGRAKSGAPADDEVMIPMGLR